MKAQATQIEDPFRCETCSGLGLVVGCHHRQPCPCDSVECPDCYDGVVPCERCGENPATHEDRYEFAFRWQTDLICDACHEKVENGPPDSAGEAWWYETHHETDWQAEKARRETR